MAYFCIMFALLLSLLLTGLPQDSLSRQSLPSATDSLVSDTLKVDTMKEVTVRAGRHIPLPGMVVNPGLKDEVVPPPSLGSVLEKLSPGINDKILHPFAFKQRKRERRQKRMQKALEDFARVKTFDELLREAYEAQMREDSLQKAKSEFTDDSE